MNENLGINMSSYLEWNILLAVLALFGNFPYGPPLSPNGIWDSFVSLAVTLTHQQHNIVYTVGNFLCNICIHWCLWRGESQTVCCTHTLTHRHKQDQDAHCPLYTSTHRHVHAINITLTRLDFNKVWLDSRTSPVNMRVTYFCTLATWE